jgi:nitroreductase
MTIADRHLAPVRAVQPDPVATAPAADLRRAWAAMTTLRPVESSISRSVLSADLAVAADILGEAIHRTGPSGARRVPSAGAIFPYETLALCRAPCGVDGFGWGLFRIEGPSGTCTRMAISHTSLRRLVAAMPGAPGVEGCYLIVLTRPWLSIRKYGPRGYLYTQLDAAHAAVNIVGVALSTGAAVLHAGLPAPAAGALRNDFPRFHELHSVIQLARVPAYPGDPMVTVREEVPARRTAQAYDFEARAWGSIVVPLHAAADVAMPAEPRDTTIVTLPGARPDLTLRAEWRELSAARRSAKRFAAEPLSGARLASTIGALATPLPTTFAEIGAGSTGGSPSGRASVSATVIVHDRLELSVAEQVAITGCARLVRYAATSDSVSWNATSFISACMGQAHIGDAQAFVLLHTAPGLLAAGTTGHDIRRALLRAGAGAQLLCLAATRDHVAVSPIGGFDSVAWARIAQLPGGTELLYLLALGTPVAESGPARNDRAEKATAHGEF